MANEERKDFNAMLHDSKDMPKLQIVTDEKTIAKYGGNRMYFRAAARLRPRDEADPVREAHHRRRHPRAFCAPE